jgi:CHAT domain-containing protein/tetratricopeptide (TPR) repeat protein
MFVFGRHSGCPRTPLARSRLFPIAIWVSVVLCVPAARSNESGSTGDSAHEFLTIDCQQDPRSKLKCFGDVSWRSGRLEIRQAAAIGAVISAGPVLQLTVALNALTTDQEKLATHFRLWCPDASDIEVRLSDFIREGKSQTRVVVVRRKRPSGLLSGWFASAEANTKWQGKKVRIADLPGTTYAAQWRLGYAYGQLTLERNGVPVVRAYVENDQSGIEAIGLYQHRAKSGVQRLAITGSLPLPKLEELPSQELMRLVAVEEKLTELYEAGQLPQARELLKQFDRDTRQFLADRPYDLADILEQNADAYATLDRVATALRVMKDARGVRHQLLGEQHVEFAHTLNDLATLYTTIGDHRQAEPLLEQALDILRDVLGHEHASYVTVLVGLAEVRLEMGKLDAAESLAREALQIQQRLTGQDSSEYVTALQTLGSIHVRRCEFEKAEEVFQQAQAGLARHEGRDSTSYAECLLNQATLHESAGRYVDAEERYLRSLEVLEQSVGSDHSDYATALAYLADLLRNVGRFDESERRLAEATRVSVATRGEDSLAYAECRNMKALLLDDRGRYAEALPLYEQALRIAERVLGKRSLGYARVSTNLARLRFSLEQSSQAREMLEGAYQIYRELVGPGHSESTQALIGLQEIYSQEGKYEEAYQVIEEARSVLERTLGKQHVAYADCIARQGMLRQLLGDFDGAEELITTALRIVRDRLGDAHPVYARALNGVAWHYEELGEFARAEPLYREAVEIIRRTLGEEHPDTAELLTDLARLYLTMGDTARAAPLLEQAKNIRERTLGDQHLAYADSLKHLGSLYTLQRQFDVAEPLFQRSFAIEEVVVGRDHPSSAETILNLAGVHVEQGKYASAVELYRQAETVFRKSLGANHPYRAECLNDLGNALLKQGSVAAAREPFFQAAEVLRNSLGEEHVDYAVCLINLAACAWIDGDDQQAAEKIEQSQQIISRILSETFGVLSERQQMAFVRNAREVLDATMTLAVTAEFPLEEAYQHLLQWKGAVFARQKLSRLAREDPRFAEMFEQLQVTCTQLASTAFAQPETGQQESWQNEIDRLTQKKERIEADLVRLSGELVDGQPRRRPTPEQIRRRLAPGTALVDFFEYTQFQRPEEGHGLETRQHLLAFVMVGDRPMALVELGPVGPIEAAVALWREAIVRGEGGLRGAQRIDPRDRQTGESPAAELRRLVWQPLETHLDRVHTILVSPDGALARCPLAALPGRQEGKYLLEEVALAVIPVPQLLAESRVSQDTDELAVAPTTDFLLVGNVDFEADPDLSGTKQKGNSNRADSYVSRSAPRTAEGFQFSPLAGTLREAEAIRRIFQATHHDGVIADLRGREATEARVRETAAKQHYIHLATHGFFAPPALASALGGQSRTDRAAWRFRATLSGYDPSLLSGLALAGANRGVARSDDMAIWGDDGILTAAEVAQIDLRDTELVVLSACETGLGEVAGGEGILGLQRAFQLAGAKTVIASLWQVSDEATLALMAEFYRNLWQRRLGKREALRQAQLAVLRGELDTASVEGLARSAPRYWAGFLLSGTWD